jgi:hypothetical protein
MARTNGAKSYANIRIGDLSEVFSENTIVPVSRVWLRMMNVDLKEGVVELEQRPEASAPPPAEEPTTTDPNADAEAVLAGVSESSVEEHAD